MTRTYRIRKKPDLHPGPSGYGTSGMDWQLHLYGRGSGSICNGYAGAFTSEEAARQSGETWVELGLPPSEQTPERIARARRDKELLENAGVDPESLGRAA